MSTPLKIFSALKISDWILKGVNNSVINAWNVDSQASPMHFFIHSVSRTKQNLLRWRFLGICHIDNEIFNIEKETINIEDINFTSNASWRATWL